MTEAKRYRLRPHVVQAFAERGWTLTPPESVKQPEGERVTLYRALRDDMTPMTGWLPSKPGASVMYESAVFVRTTPGFAPKKGN